MYEVSLWCRYQMFCRKHDCVLVAKVVLRIKRLKWLKDKETSNKNIEFILSAYLKLLGLSSVIFTLQLCHVSGMLSQITGNSIACSASCWFYSYGKHHNSTLLGLCEANLPKIGGFPSQRDSNSKSVSTSWGHYDGPSLSSLSVQLVMAFHWCLITGMLCAN